MIIKKKTPTFILQFHVWYANLAIDHKWQISDSSEYTRVYILYFVCYVNVAQISQNWLQRTSFNITFNETRWQTLNCCGNQNKSHEKCLSDIFCVKFEFPDNHHKWCSLSVNFFWSYFFQYRQCSVSLLFFNLL